MTPRPQTALCRRHTFYIIFGVVLIYWLAASILPLAADATTWGWSVAYLRSYPFVIRIVIVVSAIGAVWVAYAASIVRPDQNDKRKLARKWRTILRKLQGLRRFANVLIIASTVLVLTLLRSRNPILGDNWGAHAEGSITDPSLRWFMSSPASSWLLYIAFVLGHKLLGISGTEAIRGLSIVAGIAYILVLRAYLLPTYPSQLRYVVGILLSVGAWTQIFFGYSEIMALGVPFEVIVVSSLGQSAPASVRYKRTAYLSCAALFHAGALVLLPAIFIWDFACTRSVDSRADRFPLQFLRWSVSTAPWRIMLCFIAPLIVFFALVEINVWSEFGLHAWQLGPGDLAGGGNHVFFAPLIATGTEQYTMFSLTHAIQVLNQQLLILGVNYALMIVVLILILKQGLHNEWLAPVTVVAMYLLVMLTYETGTGVGDWDLFSPAGCVVTAAMLSVLSSYHGVRDSRVLKYLLVPLIVTQSMSGFMWIWSNHSFINN